MSLLPDLASCLSDHDPEALPLAAAREAIGRLLSPVTTVERLPLRAALGRVLAHDLVSSIDVPPHDNSAMDGYALRGRDLQPGAATLLPLVGTGLAGHPVTAPVPPGAAVRIMTGAPMPAGLDTVVPQELVHCDGLRLTVPPDAVRAGANRRRAGEDLARGERALSAGRRLRPADLGLLASLGTAEVPVLRRLRVAFFSTGDELRSVGQALDPGCVYDSNRYTLWGMLQRLEVEVIDLGVVPDRPAPLAEAFRAAAGCADVVLTSGGVSVGDADHTRRVMAEVGEVLFWKLALRPGRPLAIGRIAAPSGAGSALLFGLPGNPVAVMVTFYALVRDALLTMSGASSDPLPMLRASSLQALNKKPGRTEFLRGIVQRGSDGRWQVGVTGSQGSGVLRSMSLANGLVVLPHERGPIAVGDEVEVLPFEGLL